MAKVERGLVAKVGHLELVAGGKKRSEAADGKGKDKGKGGK